MVGRPRQKRGQRGGRNATASRSPIIDDKVDTVASQSQQTPLAPPPPPLKSQISPQTPPHSPPSSGGSKRKFEDIAEVQEPEQDCKTSFSANASIMTTSERTSRKRRSTYTLAASIASIEKGTLTRSRRSAVERSITRNPLSSGFSKPNDSEKLVVKSRDGRECWLCSQSNTVMLETAHNVVASNRDLFLNYRDTVGIFPPNLRHLASPHNLVTLCRNCHCVYDCQQPRWIILPTNLEYFINHETADYESRIQAALKGATKNRTVPTAVEYATASPENLYMPYFFEESVMPRMDPEDASSRFPRAYGGAPTTMILKAGLGINQPKIKASKNSSLPFDVGLPPSVRQQVTHLFELWDRDPPSPKKQPKSPLKPSSKEDDAPPGSETDENNSQTGNKKRKPRGNPSNRKRKSPHSSQPAADDHQDELADICAPTRKKARVVSGGSQKMNEISPSSQNTTINSAAHSTVYRSQTSSAMKRYNLRSYYRTPPTSPEFIIDSSAKRVGGGKRKSNEIDTEVRSEEPAGKRKRESSSSESVLQKRAKRVAKATNTKKDDKMLVSKTKGSKKNTTPLTPARSRPSPNDPISTREIKSLVKGSGIKKRKMPAEMSAAKKSIKKNAAKLFADVEIAPRTAYTLDSREDMKSSIPKRKDIETKVSDNAHSLPLEEQLIDTKDVENEGCESGASNIDSLDAQSGGEDDYDGEDDGYASDSGSERPDKEDWAWGPSHTANDVVETCVGWFGVGTSGRISE